MSASSTNNPGYCSHLIKKYVVLIFQTDVLEKPSTPDLSDNFMLNPVSVIVWCAKKVKMKKHLSFLIKQLNTTLFFHGHHFFKVKI